LGGGELSTTTTGEGSPQGAEMIARLQASGLRGRGGGWFPAARKWQAVRVEGGEPLVIGNGAEGEPGSVKDRWLMLRRPREVLRGLWLAARGVGAAEAVVYLKGSFAAPAAALQRALEDEPLRDVAVTIVRGDDS
jgi:NADH:ubiquinone oxidoreductase subunit F (NADH-binding)